MLSTQFQTCDETMPIGNACKDLALQVSIAEFVTQDLLKHDNETPAIIRIIKAWLIYFGLCEGD
jgi:hypothetical protein